jgi:ATP-dependent protease ClpP protease subunit
MKYILALALLFTCSVVNAKTIRFTTLNVCSIEGPVTVESVRKAKHCLGNKNVKRGRRNYPLYLYLYSPGGSVYQGLKLIEFAKGIRDLHTVTNFAASMASAIVEHLPGKRYAVEHNIFMFHRARGSFSGQFETGEVEKQVKFWKGIVRNMSRKNADRIGMTLKHYDEVIKDEWWIYGKDSVKMNICDEIVQLTCSKNLMARTQKIKVRSLFGSYVKQVSECPILN